VALPGVFNLCQHFEISHSRNASKHFITGVYITINDNEHFFLRCSVLDKIRNSTFHDMDIEFNKLTQKKLEDLTDKEKIAIILDCSILLNNGTYHHVQHRATIKKLTA